MALWDLVSLSGSLQSMCADLETLKVCQVGSKDTFTIQKRFMSTATEILAITCDPAQAVKNVARGVSRKFFIPILPISIELVY